MRYRELLENEKKLREEMGNLQYIIALDILEKSNGKLSSSETLSIVSTITDEEADIIYHSAIVDKASIRIETDPRKMALFLDLTTPNPRRCRPESEWGATRNRLHRVLLGDCEWGTAEKECDFDIDDKLAILHTCICSNCTSYERTGSCGNQRACIYIYIPNGEYI